ncbi:hypothetical protein Gogos_021284 [Gossypium gossypioides]|uniref:Uncharacterized protein n=1 Tax=Gossypium gossypioides TaxID=34282 RepID=A0A7J9D3Y2_GOSGO|nr:hypothetical protein [Gossypium gossypioides]
MRDQIQESQRSMISQLTQLLVGGIKKGKSIVVNSGDDNEYPTYPRLYLDKCPGPTRYISTKGTCHYKTLIISSQYLSTSELPNKFRFQC